MIQRTLRPADLLLELQGQALLSPEASCVSDTRQLKAGDAFFAWAGERFDPRQNIQALAVAVPSVVFVDANDLPADFAISAEALACPVYLVEDLKSYAGQIAAQLLGNQQAALPLIAVTGTNGKTSVTRWVAQCLDALHQRCAVVGTLGAGFVDEVAEVTGLTTPDAVTLQAVLAKLRVAGAAGVALEASSIGLEQGRLNGCLFSTVAFTNFSRDHLDYHADMQAYEAAKMLLAKWPGVQSVVANMDDPHAVRFMALAVERGALPIQVGSDAAAFCEDFKGLRLVVTGVHCEAGLSLTFALGAQTLVANVSVIGQFNVENIAVMAGILLAQGHKLTEIVSVVSCITSPPGRMTPVTMANGPLLVVDYAHTPDALEKVLNALRPLAASRQGALTCVFGCGGDRDPGKRPLMASIAQRLADKVFATSDNPRNENAQAILADVCKGFSAHALSKVTVEADRERAIALSVAAACAGDVVLLAGKGHETGQIIGDQVLPFSDLDHAGRALSRWHSNLAGRA
ncbi:MAG: UDP-N-acetylmuramoyl-L-alanyl-D-glutamate--2,6-diaminopimelate ligase [Burkholderiales bacterium]|nr:UDP-N-acetylmuramoyl-L-alanyl-D-glutamate--2,6-diaminopimelate ligase [Burkholderiales bacterium]